jgi:hypothetical protein
VKTLVIVALCAALLAAGCGDGDSASPEPTTTSRPAPRTRPEPAAGKVLEHFVQAAGAGNTGAMFALLSTRARSRFGPTAAAFGKGTGKELATALGLFEKTGGYDVSLSVRATSLWAVAAITGFAVHEGEKQYGAYAAPLLKQAGEWKIELGGTVTFGPLTPDTQLPSDATPDISSEITASEPILESRIWVDRQGIAPDVSPDELLLSAEVTSPLPPGRHTVVTFASTQSSAGANAFVFTVK